MTNTLTRPTADAPVWGTTTRRRHRNTRLFTSVVALVVLAALAVAVAVVITYRTLTDDSRRDYLGSGGWPANGQAAISLGAAGTEIGPGQTPAPIASVAKVMTAYVVLQAHPLPPGADGFTVRITEADVRRTEVLRGQDQSLVPVAAGEELTQRQALQALLLPSANNVAEFLARRVAGSQRAFVARMNAAAHRLGMHQTRYADASGYDPRTVSTARDQLELAKVVARDRTFSAIVATTSATIPVAGTIRNTDTLLGHDGFIGTKTGSHNAAGGCFMFRAQRVVNGRPVDVVGVVLGQDGHNLAEAGQYAARQLVASLSSPR